MPDKTRPKTTHIASATDNPDYDLLKLLRRPHQPGMDRITVLTPGAEPGQYNITVCEGPCADTVALEAARVIHRTRNTKR